MSGFVRRLKTVSSLSVLTLAGVVAVQGCSGEHSESESSQDLQGTAVIASEGEGGEGEGQSEGQGESEGGSSYNPATDDAEYLHRLGQVRGHLIAFITLHNLGADEMSATHAKHPESELYADLIPAFKARKLPGFAAELDALTSAMARGTDIDSAYSTLQAAISNNEPQVSVSVWLKAMATLARTAGDEFKIGVGEDGTVTNAHEYQDAFGFLMAARDMLARLSPSNDDEKAAIAKVDGQLDLALEEFSDLRATKIDGRSSPIYGAAARIELAALALD